MDSPNPASGDTISRLVARSGGAAAAFILLTAAAGCAPPEVEVTAIANEGFLVRTSRHAVLVDALFRATAPYPEFFQQGPSEELLERMIAGEGVFDGIDLALVTHSHGDHFHAQTAFDFLERHPESVLVGTDDVAAALAEIDGFRRIVDRVITPNAAIGDCVRMRPAGVEMTVCPVHHSGGGEPVNNIYIVDLDGIRFLHEGDADMGRETFEGLDIGSFRLDLAFMHGWYAFDSNGREIVTDILRPRALVLMHDRWVVAAETRDRIAGLPPEVAATLPPITVFGAEGQNASFGPPA